jgi:hypothetical protein
MIDSKGYSGVPSIISDCIVAKKITTYEERTPDIHFCDIMMRFIKLQQ